MFEPNLPSSLRGRCLEAVEKLLFNLDPEHWCTANTIKHLLELHSLGYFKEIMIAQCCDVLSQLDNVERYHSGRGEYLYRYNYGWKAAKEAERAAKKKFYKNRYYEAKGWERK